MNECYLGGGLYASFDGFHIRLRAPRAKDGDDLVYLEPEILNEFERYIKVLRSMVSRKRGAK